MKENKQSRNIIVIIYTISQLLGWSYVLYETIKYTVNYHDSKSLNKALLALKIFQLTQFLDVLFAKIKLTKANFTASLIQVTARNLSAFWFYHEHTPRNIILMTLFAWCIAEIVRSLYYLLKDYYFIQFLRYNLFIILYPIGITGEILASEFYRANNPEWTIPMRLGQIVFIVGFLYLYKYLFHQRREFYQKSIVKKIN